MLIALDLWYWYICPVFVFSRKQQNIYNQRCYFFLFHLQIEKNQKWFSVFSSPTKSGKKKKKNFRAEKNFLFFSEIFMEKHWRTIITKTICDYFFNAQSKVKKDTEKTFHFGFANRTFLFRSQCAKPEDIEPVIATAHHFLVNIHRKGLYFIAVLNQDGSKSEKQKEFFFHRKSFAFFSSAALRYWTSSSNGRCIWRLFWKVQWTNIKRESCDRLRSLSQWKTILLFESLFSLSFWTKCSTRVYRWRQKSAFSKN